MSINGAIQVGQSALAVSQAALQVAGNNLANAATEGFSRRVVDFSPIRDEVTGRNQYVGRGVQLQSIRRAVDEALIGRYRDALSEQASARTSQGLFGQLETIQNELTENDLSTLFSEFFNAWSELANNPSDNAIRAVVIQQGENIAGRMADMNSDYARLRDQTDRQLRDTVEAANDILEKIAQINLDIGQLEVNQGEAAALRDQRDLLLNELAGYVDITSIEMPSGAVNVLVNSTPILIGTDVRGMEVRAEAVEGDIDVSLRVAADGSDIVATRGTIGSLLEQRDGGTGEALDALGAISEAFVFAVNRLHSQGQGERGFESVVANQAGLSTTAAINLDESGIPFDVENGSFFIHVTHQETGQRESFRVDVDGTMSLEDAVEAINVTAGVPNVTAGLNARRELTLDAAAGYEMSFSDDSSGFLAAVGINTFFVGSTPSEIGVADSLIGDPTRLAVAMNHVPGSNDTALAIAALQDQKLGSLNEQSIREAWQNQVNTLAVNAGAAQNSAESAAVVTESLFAQIQAISGVSVDEETIKLITFQRQFQAAARFITVADEMLQSLLNIV